jgi:hypothetical protein
VVILTPLKATMDVDGDYYWRRWKDINGLWLFKGIFMTFVGGDTDN